VKAHPQKRVHPYDRTLKALFGDEAAEILPQLLPGTELLHDQNIEIDRTTLKADLVYNTHYKRLPHILNMELQTDEDDKMHLRLLQYHANLLEKYEKPVLSVVLYPFERKVPIPPFKEMSGDEALLIWKYLVIGLYNLEAERFRREQAFCMYSLLPAYEGGQCHHADPDVARHQTALPAGKDEASPGSFLENVAEVGHSLERGQSTGRGGITYAI
jgi:hypothetical protein